jgi:threonine synthase
MDIQVSSNFERALFYAYGGDGNAVAQLMDELKSGGGFHVSQGALETLRADFASGRCGEAETSAMIKRALPEMGELLCPHSAVGVHVAQDHLGATPMITLATAHPAKFPAAVEEASGIHPALPPRMGDLFDRPERLTRVENDLTEIETLIREELSA